MRDLAQTSRLPNAMGGCRLTDLGLHFGHFWGCLSRRDLTACGHYFFVIRDGEYLFNFGDERTSLAVISFAADVLACSGGRPVWVVRQTQVLATTRRLRELLFNIATANQLLNAHSLRRHLKRGLQTRLTVAQLLFPIDSAATYIGLGASQICMNDDNTRFVGFGAHLAHVLNSAGFRYPLPIPTLRTGALPHIDGWNYQKMSVSNQNALYYRFTDQELTAAVERIFRKSAFFKKYSHEHALFTANPRLYKFDQRFLPYEYFIALDDVTAAEEFVRGVTMDQFCDLKRRLNLRLLEHFREWRRARTSWCGEAVDEHLRKSRELMSGIAKPIDDLCCSLGSVA